MDDQNTHGSPSVPPFPLPLPDQALSGHRLNTVEAHPPSCPVSYPTDSSSTEQQLKRKISVSVTSVLRRFSTAGDWRGAIYVLSHAMSQRQVGGRVLFRMYPEWIYSVYRLIPSSSSAASPSLMGTSRSTVESGPSGIHRNQGRELLTVPHVRLAFLRQVLVTSSTGPTSLEPLLEEYPGIFVDSRVVEASSSKTSHEHSSPKLSLDFAQHQPIPVVPVVQYSSSDETVGAHSADDRVPPSARHETPSTLHANYVADDGSPKALSLGGAEGCPNTLLLAPRPLEVLFTALDYNAKRNRWFEGMRLVRACDTQKLLCPLPWEEPNTSEIAPSSSLPSNQASLFMGENLIPTALLVVRNLLKMFCVPARSVPAAAALNAPALFRQCSLLLGLVVRETREDDLRRRVVRGEETRAFRRTPMSSQEKPLPRLSVPVLDDCCRLGLDIVRLIRAHASFTDLKSILQSFPLLAVELSRCYECCLNLGRIDDETGAAASQGGQKSFKLNANLCGLIADAWQMLLLAGVVSAPGIREAMWAMRVSENPTTIIARSVEEDEEDEESDNNTISETALTENESLRSVAVFGEFNRLYQEASSMQEGLNTTTTHHDYHVSALQTTDSKVNFRLSLWLRFMHRYQQPDMWAKGIELLLMHRSHASDKGSSLTRFLQGFSTPSSALVSDLLPLARYFRSPEANRASLSTRLILSGITDIWLTYFSCSNSTMEGESRGLLTAFPRRTPSIRSTLDLFTQLFQALPSREEKVEALAVTLEAFGTHCCPPNDIVEGTRNGTREQGGGGGGHPRSVSTFRSTTRPVMTLDPMLVLLLDRTVEQLPPAQHDAWRLDIFTLLIQLWIQSPFRDAPSHNNRPAGPSTSTQHLAQLMFEEYYETHYCSSSSTRTQTPEPILSRVLPFWNIPLPVPGNFLRAVLIPLFDLEFRTRECSQQQNHARFVWDVLRRLTTLFVRCSRSGPLFPSLQADDGVMQTVEQLAQCHHLDIWCAAVLRWSAQSFPSCRSESLLQEGDENAIHTTIQILTDLLSCFRSMKSSAMDMERIQGEVRRLQQDASERRRRKAIATESSLLHVHGLEMGNR